MFKLNYVSPENAEGSIKDAYSVFPPQVGVPAPIQMSSISPALLINQIESLKYFMNHPNLTFPVLSAIRFMSASELCYEYCTGLNSGMLKKAGMTEEDLDSLLGDMTDLPFEENEILLLKLVKKVIKEPKSVTDSDIEECRKAGWTDSDIYDASYHGSILAVPSRLFSAFKK